MKASSDIYTWPIALVFGSLITVGLFFTIPALRIRQPNPEPPVITIDFMQWREPAPVPKVKTPPAPKPKVQAKPRPVVSKPKLRPKPQSRKPLPLKPVVKQPVIPEKAVAPQPPAPTKPVQQPKPQPQQIEAPTTAAKTTEQDVPPPTPIFQLTSLPRFAHKVEPQYPPAMRALGREARLQVEALIDPRGRVRKVTILKSGGELFDQAAIKALMASTFVPGNVEGKRVTVLLRMPIIFRLK